MILLVHLKFCWCILNFAGADFEVKSAPAKYMHQQNSAGVHQTLAARGLEEPQNSQELLIKSVDFTKFVGPLPFSV